MRATRSRAGLAIRLLGPGDVGDALLDLRSRAFGPLTGEAQARWRAEHQISARHQRYLGAFDGPRLIAAARFHDMTQWWNGRAVPMAGVAGVMVAPEERGRGVGRALMTDLLEQIASRGYPLSALFPSTLPVYRALGWEIAGTSHEAVLPAHALRALAPADAAVTAADAAAATPSGATPAGAAPAGAAPAGPAPAGPAPAGPAAVRRAGPDDAAEALAVLGRVYGAARDSGPATREAELLGLALGHGLYYGYLAEDGVLLYTWRSGHDEVFVPLAAAASEQTTRALWGIIGSHCWVAETVRARIGPADPLWWLTREPVAETVDHDDWMLRVVDAPAAVAARGFPPAATLAVPLRIADAARPANSGLWRLDVSGGRGSLTRDGRPAENPDLAAAAAPDRQAAAAAPGRAAAVTGPLTLGARGLAALYAGTPVAALRRAGLAAGGDPAADALLDGAFAATPYMPDRF